jgi:hypothetical protein
MLRTTNLLLLCKIAERLQAAARARPILRAPECPALADFVYRFLDMAQEDWQDPVVEAYKKDVDVTLLRKNLRLTPEERTGGHGAPEAGGGGPSRRP